MGSKPKIQVSIQASCSCAQQAPAVPERYGAKTLTIYVMVEPDNRERSN